MMTKRYSINKVAGQKKGGFMLLDQNRVKKTMIIAFIVAAFLFLHVQSAIASSVAIKGATKVHRNGGYVISINYETRDRWTDNILFKVHCKFDKKELAFNSSSMNNVERGWHKTKIAISKVMKKRYGSLREYEISLYKNGILVDTEKHY